MTTTNTSGRIREGQDRGGQTGGQIRLPGQTHVAEGPHDQTGMYLAHHAFRRDLANVESAVRHTPVGRRRDLAGAGSGAGSSSPRSCTTTTPSRTTTSGPS